MFSMGGLLRSSFINILASFRYSTCVKKFQTLGLCELNADISRSTGKNTPIGDGTPLRKCEVCLECGATLIAVREFRTMPIYHVPRVKNTPIGDGTPLRISEVALGLCQLSIGSCEKNKVP